MAEWKLVSFEDGVDTKIATHTAIASAHHTKYTDAEVDAIVATHTAIAAAHHVKYTDAEVDAIVAAHTAIAAAHHVKYTDAEAVSAVATADDYVKNDADDEMVGALTIKKSEYPQLFVTGNDTYGMLRFSAYSGETLKTQMQFFAYHTTENRAYIQSGIAGTPAGDLLLTGLGSITGNNLVLMFSIIDFQNNTIKNPKNHAATALSGTKKLVEIDIGGTSYYFEVYPTKA